MKMIPFTKGYWTKVDDEDWPRLILTSWYAQETNGGVYAARRVSNGEGQSHIELMHRVVADAPADVLVDHEDHDTLNNQSGNLRHATSNDNQGNSRKNKPATSIYKGVYWLTARQRWVADITPSGVTERIGSFKSEKEAARAYDLRARVVFGPFACLNFPEETHAV